MTMYMLTEPRIVDALVAAKKNGADVRALLEEHPFGAASAGDEATQDLQAAGIEVKYANPAFRLTHQKSFVVDDAAVIMTANMTKSAFSRNREFIVVHTAPADVAEVADAFKADWERSEFTPASAALVWSPVNSRARIDGVIRAATRTLEVYAEVVQDKKQVALLAETAQRGVAVRLIISPKSSTPTGDSPDETGLDALQAAGVSIRHVKSPYIHAKAFVADGGLAFVGSENVTASSLDFNRELGILFTDAAAIQRLAATFEKDWQKGVER